MERNKLFFTIKRAVQQIDAQAQVFLYGSRARGDATPDSDWDLLILLSPPINRTKRTRLRHALYDVELEVGEILNAVVEDADYWVSERNRYSPFYQNVKREGIAL
ncbi:MAG TPA: nucleotidyltransferase domain-containing protein [Anaerolineae bacterium]|nr:nucleotidyltransferase domain-containing protein [Anaerolineae bacterium]HQI87238.1 nucleotidyltransferase domain-containing protein [Anaerolineae bacterium]